MLLQDRICLVTGAGRGIGRSIALSYAKEGARVAITARTVPELDETASAIRSLGAAVLTIPADLADSAAPKQIVDRVRKEWGAIQVLVNNAGIGSSAGPKPLVEFDDDFWELTLRVNLTAPYLLCKLVLPEMLKARSGRIITVASINGKIGSLHGAAYAASKHGVLGMMRTLAMEVAADGITVNSICPGPVHTAMSDKRIAYDAQRRGMTIEDIDRSITPIGRRLEPDEIAPLAVYLASDGSAAMTGQSINIDGGYLMTG